MSQKKPGTCSGRVRDQYEEFKKRRGTERYKSNSRELLKR